MWKVKRMNTAPIVVQAIAVGSGVAACLGSGSGDRPTAIGQVSELQPVDIVATRSDLGQTARRDDPAWPMWPAATGNAFIRRNSRADSLDAVRRPGIRGATATRT